MSFAVSRFGAGHRDRADPHRAEQRRVPLRDPRQHHEYVVTLAHAEIQQHPRCLARGARQISRRLLGYNLPDRVERQHRERVGVLRRPSIDDVEHRVEALGHLDAVARAFGVDIPQARGAIASGTIKRNGRHRDHLRLAPADHWISRANRHHEHHADAFIGSVHRLSSNGLPRFTPRETGSSSV